MIYRLECEHLLSLADSADYHIFKTWKHPQPIETWTPLSLNPTSESSLPDVMGLRSIMIWRSELVDNLPDTVYQALPVTIDNETYFAIHITHSLDCLDPVESVFKRFKNRNIGVEQYVMRADCVGDAMLFTIPDDGYSAIFASEAFKAQVEQAGWTGLSFIPIAVSGLVGD